MPEINFVDPSLKNYFDNTEVSIQVSLDGFSFCINSVEDDVIRAFRHYKFSHTVLQEDLLNKTDEVLHKDELLRMPHDLIRVCFLGRKSTIVPKGYAEPDAFKSILEFNQPIDELDEIHANLLPACEAKLIFAVPTYFAGLITDRFTNTRFINQATPLICHSLNECSPNKDLISIQINTDFFDLVIVREGKLVLYNSFLYVNSTDLLYFILYACKQLNLNLKNIPVILTGEHGGDEALIKELKIYLKKMKSLNTSDIKLGSALRKLDQSRFFNLLNLWQCE